MSARPCDGEFSCLDHMLVGYRCSGPLMLCDGGAHAPSERHTFARGAAPRVTVSRSRVGVEGRGRVPGVSGDP
eukprot:1983966-Prymnesium_polylepis.1